MQDIPDMSGDFRDEIDGDDFDLFGDALPPPKTPRGVNAPNTHARNGFRQLFQNVQGLMWDCLFTTHSGRYLAAKYGVNESTICRYRKRARRDLLRAADGGGMKIRFRTDGTLEFLEGKQVLPKKLRSFSNG